MEKARERSDHLTHIGNMTGPMIDPKRISASKYTIAVTIRECAYIGMAVD